MSSNGNTPKEEFERAKLCYEQNCQQFRSLNQIMWQVPIIAMTLTGGLWFGAASVDGIEKFSYGLLLLAAIGNFGLIRVLARVRFVMGQYLSAMRDFHAVGFVEASGDSWWTSSKAVVGTFQWVLAISSLMSLIGCAWLLWEDKLRPLANVESFGAGS